MLRTIACAFCLHLHCKPREEMLRNGYTCDAFPGGIPEEITRGRNQHMKPYPGDHGIQFEPNGSEAAAIYAAPYTEADLQQIPEDLRDRVRASLRADKLFRD